MIAPLRKSTDRGARWKQTRRDVVRTLLRAKPTVPGVGPAIAAWKAWLWAGWSVLVVAVYVARMLGG